MQHEVDGDLEEDVSEQEDNVEENSDYSPFDEDDSGGEEQAARQKFMSENSAICWSYLPCTAASAALLGAVKQSEPGPDPELMQRSQHERTEEKRMQLMSCKGKRDYKTGTTC